MDDLIASLRDSYSGNEPGLSVLLRAAAKGVDALEAQAARIAQLEKELAAAGKALKSAAHRLNAAAVSMAADGKDLAADKFTEWANEAYNLAGDPE